MRLLPPACGRGVGGEGFGALIGRASRHPQPVVSRRCCGRRSPASSTRGSRCRREKMRKAPLQLQIFGDRHLAADLALMRDDAVLGFEDREQPALDREPRQLDRVLRRRAPAERAGHVDLDIARAVNAHRLGHLALEVVQVGDGRGRDIGNAVRDRDLRHELAGAEDVARLLAHRRRRRGARRRRRRRRALHAGVHVGFVVVADVEHVVVALEHAGQAAEADIGRAAVAALGDHAHSSRPCTRIAAATPVATAAALPNSECIHGICHEVSG